MALFNRQKKSTIVILLMMLAVVCSHSEDTSEDFSIESADEDNGVTITNCYPSDSENRDSVPDDDETNTRCMSANIHRKSGYMTLSDNPLGHRNEFLMSVELISLGEVSPCGQPLATAGLFYNGFSDEMFKFSELQEGYYDDLSGIAVKFISFNATLPNSAIINIIVYLMKGSGVISNGDETFTVRPGVAKINVQIRNWQFCGVEDVICEQCPFYEIGKYLDLDLAVKGTSAAVQKDTSENRGVLFNVGPGDINFSQKINIDGNESPIPMTEGYPAYSSDGLITVFQLRFPKFESEIIYDPTIRRRK